MKKSRTWGHWIFWLFLIELVVLTFLIPVGWMQDTLKFETRRIEHSLGEAAPHWIADKANGWFQASFIDSGFYRGLHRVLIPSESEKQRTQIQTPALERIGSFLFDWLEARLEALMRILYQLCVRVALL